MNNNECMYNPGSVMKTWSTGDDECRAYSEEYACGGIYHNNYMDVVGNRSHDCFWDCKNCKFKNTYKYANVELTPNVFAHIMIDKYMNLQFTRRECVDAIILHHAQNGGICNKTDYANVFKKAIIKLRRDGYVLENPIPSVWRLKEKVVINEVKNIEKSENIYVESPMMYDLSSIKGGYVKTTLLKKTIREIMYIRKAKDELELMILEAKIDLLYELDIINAKIKESLMQHIKWVRSNTFVDDE